MDFFLGVQLHFTIDQYKKISPPPGIGTKDHASAVPPAVRRGILRCFLPGNGGSGRRILVGERPVQTAAHERKPCSPTGRRLPANAAFSVPGPFGQDSSILAFFRYQLHFSTTNAVWQQLFRKNHRKPGGSVPPGEISYCRPLPALTLSNSASICASGSAVSRETTTITITLKTNAGSSS